MTYAKQLKGITGENGFLQSLTCCNRKVYALNSSLSYGALIQLDIVINDQHVVITLLPSVDVPSGMPCNSRFSFLKGCTELFYVQLGVLSKSMRMFTDVHLFKLDTATMLWKKPEDLNNTVFFIDLSHPSWFFYRPTISSESGGYVHIFGKTDKVMSSYDLTDNTVSLSSMPCLVPTNQVPPWERRAEEDKEDEIVSRDDDINSTRTSPLSDISSDVLKKIMELCVGVQYLNFRATCKQCHLAAPAIRWSKEPSLRRLQTYSLPSPWLMVFDTHRGIITFTDPMFGDKYYMKTPQELIGNAQIRCSRYGWLLVYNLSHEPVSMMLFNPFTNDIRKYPFTGYVRSSCFSAPPTSWDCMVVGLVADGTCAVFIQPVNSGLDWGAGFVEFGEVVPRSISFPTLYGKDVYALEAGGRLHVYRLTEIEGSFWEVVAEAQEVVLQKHNVF
ncbi:hypothetical protein HanPI659440_Chr11g0428051 [Helianthus annuus]|nr:hypothetical protein HanPI659440_Chr11g0428051 [Helianthus annuus]